MVLPSVNMTITFWLEEGMVKSWDAWKKASAWLVEPPATRLSTADFRSATDVISGALTVAVSEKLTIPMRLPEPICPSLFPSVASSMISMKVLAPSFMLASGVPLMLPERSSTRTMSAGFSKISGAAVIARETLAVPSHFMVSTLIFLLELMMPIRFPPNGIKPNGSIYLMRQNGKRWMMGRVEKLSFLVLKAEYQLCKRAVCKGSL